MKVVKSLLLGLIASSLFFACSEKSKGGVVVNAGGGGSSSSDSNASPSGAITCAELVGCLCGDDPTASVCQGEKGIVASDTAQYGIAVANEHCNELAQAANVSKADCDLSDSLASSAGGEAGASSAGATGTDSELPAGTRHCRATSYVLNEPLFSLAASGSLLFAVNKGLTAFDLSSPTNPHELGHSDAGDAPLALDLPYLYVVTAGADKPGLSTFTYDAGAFTAVGSVSSEAALRAVAKQGSYAYAIASYSYDNDGGVIPGGLFTFDVKNPSAPSSVSQSSSDDFFGLTLNDAFLYAWNSDKVEIFSLKDTSHPTLVGSAQSGFDQRGVAIAGQTMFIAAPSLPVFDMSDPASPKALNLDIEDKQAGNVWGVRIVGTKLYVLESQQLQVLDVSDPQQPVSERVYDLSFGATQNDFAVVGNYAYIDEGLQAETVDLGHCDPH